VIFVTDIMEGKRESKRQCWSECENEGPEKVDLATNHRKLLLSWPENGPHVCRWTVTDGQKILQHAWCSMQ